MTNNTDTAREFLRNYMKWEDSQGNKLMEVGFVENALVAYASRFTPAIESGHDFLERKLKGGWRLEASDMTNCLAALLDEYGQRTPAPIGDEEIEKEILWLVPVDSDRQVPFDAMRRWLIRDKMWQLIEWYRSAQAKKEPNWDELNNSGLDIPKEII